MVKLISGNMLGMEVFIVLWSTEGRFYCRGFTSPSYAKDFIVRKFKGMTFDGIEINESNADLSSFVWMLHK